MPRPRRAAFALLARLVRGSANQGRVRAGGNGDQCASRSQVKREEQSKHLSSDVAREVHTAKIQIAFQRQCTQADPCRTSLRGGNCAQRASSQVSLRNNWLKRSAFTNAPPA